MSTTNKQLNKTLNRVKARLVTKVMKIEDLKTLELFLASAMNEFFALTVALHGEQKAHAVYVKYLQLLDKKQPHKTSN